MNNENNNVNNGQNVTNIPVTPQVVPDTQAPEILSYNTAPVQQVVPVTTPVVQQTVPVTTPVVQNSVQVPIVEPTAMPRTEVPTVPSTIPTAGPQPDNNAMINENLKKVEIKDYTPPSKLKIVGLLFFFILLVAFIIFLPQISTIIKNFGQDNTYKPETEVITTGKLICTLSTNTSELDKEYEFDFSFTDGKLKRTKYMVNTRGDSTTESSLDVLAEKCNDLKNETKDLEGVSIKCDYTDGKLSETQIFELETIDTEKLTSAFTEAGGILPSYKYDQEIDEIEKNMKASSYTCERQK